MNNIKLNSKEIINIMINVLSVKLLFTFPKKLIVLAGNAAWIEIIYMSLLILLIFAIKTTVLLPQSAVRLRRFLVLTVI